MTTLGERLRIARETRGLTQKELAKQVKVPITPTTISHIESGRNENSRYIVWIAAALNVRSEWLCTGEREMFDYWPWKNISAEDIAALPEPVLEDIGDYMHMKLLKHSEPRD